MLILRDKAYESQMNELGYIVLDFLDRNQIDLLIDLHNQIKRKIGENDLIFQQTGMAGNYRERMPMAESIRNIIQPAIDRLFHPYQLFAESIVTEVSLSDQDNLRQNFTLVNPERDNVCSLWIALNNTVLKNVPIYLVEKSHRLFQNYISASYQNDSIKRLEVESRFIKDIELKEGQVLLFRDRIFYGYRPHIADGESKAITAKIVSPGTVLMYYERVDDYNAVEYKIEPDDVIKYFDELTRREIPESFELSRNLYYRHNNINALKLNIALKKINGEKLSLLEKLQDFF